MQLSKLQPPTAAVTEAPPLPPAPAARLDASRPIAAQVSDMLVGRMKQAIETFHEWDTDRSHSIDLDEFTKAMAALGFTDAARVEALFRQCDVDGSGGIEIDELVAALEPTKDDDDDDDDGRGDTPPIDPTARQTTAGQRATKLSMKNEMRKVQKGMIQQLQEAFDTFSQQQVMWVFKQCDDGNGCITRPEFAEAMAWLGLEISTTEINYLYNQMDLDGSGRINYSEVKNYFLNVREEQSQAITAQMKADKIINETAGTKAYRVSKFG